MLFECGWINPLCIKQYTQKGSKNDGKVRDSLSVERLRLMLYNFKKEIMLLQYNAEKLGVLLERSPKCHLELAGEGIEYAWGIAKLKYRHSPLSCKRTKDLFKKLVFECLS